MNVTCQSILLILLAALLGMNYAVADNVTVNVSGKVIPTPCMLDLVNSDLDVNLGENLQAGDLANTGATSTPVSFKLVVSACPTTTTLAVASFSGTEDTGAPGRYISTGDAQNVAVEVKGVSSATTLKGPGTTMSQSVDQVAHTATFNMQANVYAKGPATPGNVAATLQVSFIYQ
ncbi:fimbrial protein [Rahnella bonaserana]|jgi:minor fimbrial subunit